LIGGDRLRHAVELDQNCPLRQSGLKRLGDPAAREKPPTGGRDRRAG
jgi:hypothetical protein